MERPFLSQEEVDALLGGGSGGTGNGAIDKEILLTPEEQDVLSEIGNINAGSATTALSELLSQRVLINTPTLKFTSSEELLRNFDAPFLAIEVEYTAGIEGNNVFILKAEDAAVIANLMMGGEGTNCCAEMDEMTLSAISEAMNQMIGFSATSMSEMFNRKIDISPPRITSISDPETAGSQLKWDVSENIVAITFSLQIGEILRSEIMLIISTEVAKQEVKYLLASTGQASCPTATEEYCEQVPMPIPEQVMTEHKGLPINNNLNLILDIPLRLSVLLGKTRRSIGDILRLSQGSILELERLETEPVDILLNDTLIAKGEVVVVKEYFGVRITDIISAENRIRSLGSN